MGGIARTAMDLLLNHLPTSLSSAAGLLFWSAVSVNRSFRRTTSLSGLSRLPLATCVAFLVGCFLAVLAGGGTGFIWESIECACRGWTSGTPKPPPPPPPLVDPNPAERGTESEVAHKWARWLHNPCCLGDPHRFRAGGRIRGGPQVGEVAT